MNSISLVLLAFIGYLVAYRTYGKFLANKIFKFSSKKRMPSKQYEDGVDFVPTKKHIVFGHHFTTIAGLGPIVGPAIGIIWGWLPAFLWVFLGAIFMGALHDFSTLAISAKHGGKSIGDLTKKLMGKGPAFAFQFIIQLLLFMVLSIFAMIVSTLFILYPESVIPVWFQVPIAIWLGKQLRNRKREWAFALFAIALMYGSIYLGMKFPIDLGQLPYIQNMNLNVEEQNNLVSVLWSLLLFVYIYIASILPVHKLLQPRDYINSQQLLIALALIVIGVFIAHPDMAAPAFNAKAFQVGSDVPNLMPLLFIVIACGAISGFHSIASSGTTIKQVEKPKDMLSIGYGSMLMEGFLAVLVLICVGAGLSMGFESDSGLLTGRAAFFEYYSSWSHATSGLGAKLQSFIIGASNLFSSMGIPESFAKPLLAVFIVSFANTTMDSALRMQRLSFQELISKKDLEPRDSKKVSRYWVTFFLVVVAATMTFLKPGGKGALLLWPLFGALNQLLAALGLAVVSVYLFKKKKNYLLAFVPMLFVLSMTVWSILISLKGFIQQKDYILILLSFLVLGLSLWLLLGGIMSIKKYKLSLNVEK